jgi:amino acid transporter
MADEAPQGGSPPRRAGFVATVRAVLWSFIGIRKHSGYQQDAGSLDPKAVVIAGVVVGVLFVLVLVAVVRLVLGALQQGGVQ